MPTPPGLTKDYKTTVKSSHRSRSGSRNAPDISTVEAAERTLAHFASMSQPLETSACTSVASSKPKSSSKSSRHRRRKGDVEDESPIHRSR